MSDRYFIPPPPRLVIPGSIQSSTVWTVEHTHLVVSHITAYAPHIQYVLGRLTLSERPGKVPELIIFQCCPESCAGPLHPP